MQNEILPTFKQYKNINWALSLSKRFAGHKAINKKALELAHRFKDFDHVATLCAHVTKRNKKINELCAQLKNQNKRILKLKSEIRMKNIFRTNFENQTENEIKRIYISNGVDSVAASEKAFEHFRRIRQAAYDLTNLPF